jgi:peptidoglycan hydrolase-like protein with peptidoglycan-binding domain
MIQNFNEFTQTNEGFWDWLTGKKEEGEAKKKGQTGASDSAVEEFYQSLQEFASTNKSIEVELSKNYTYSKVVENIQIALEFLGYKLPRYGVDGYFGPETAKAIRDFNEDTVKLSTTDHA